jgi:gamma-glutamylaminecyclotransferase
MKTINSKEPQSGALYAVYGTLRKGYGNHRLLDNPYCELLGTIKTEPKFKMVSLGGFPGVIPNEGTQEVVVEIYRVNSENVEQRLDWLEGYPSFYNKTEIPTPWGTANMYILDEHRYGSNNIVESGDWNIHTSEARKQFNNR